VAWSAHLYLLNVFANLEATTASLEVFEMFASGNCNCKSSASEKLSGLKVTFHPLISNGIQFSLAYIS